MGSYGDVGDVDLVNALRELFDKDPEKRGLLDRDFEVLGDLGFVDEQVSVMGDTGCASYKDFVSRRNNGLDNIDKINALQWAQIIAMHASKAQHLLGRARAEDCAYWAPVEDLAGAALDVDLLALHDFEARSVARGCVFPVCTCVFFACVWSGRVNGAWKKALRL